MASTVLTCHKGSEFSAVRTFFCYMRCVQFLFTEFQSVCLCEMIDNETVY